MNPSDQPREIRRLVSLASDGLLDNVGRAQLETLLESNTALVDDYTTAVSTHAMLEVACGKSVLDPLPKMTRSEVELPTSPRPPRSTSTRQFGSWSRYCLRAAPYAVSASLLLGVSFFFLARPTARIVALQEAVWSDGHVREVGGSVPRNWQNLEKGEVQLAFPSGAMVSVRGPARFRTLATKRLSLDHGVVIAHVPDSAHGFLVSTPSADVVDLGTGFRLEAFETGALELHVTAGSVRLERREQGDHALLTAGQAAEISGRDEPITVTDATMLRTSKSVTFLQSHPASLRYNAFDRDNTIAVFLESRRVRLPGIVRLGVTEAGRHEHFSGVQGRLLEDEIVDCYLVHCAPQSRRHVVEGQVTFPGRILGLICDSDSLNATNGLLGAGWTLQCSHAERGLESAPDRNSDVVVISPDRRSLSMKMRTESIDQCRVLVAPE